MASFTSINTAPFLLSYTGVPFCSDVAKIVRMPFKKGGIEADPKSQEIPEKHQPLPDLIDEIDRLIDMGEVTDVSHMDHYLGYNLSALAHRTPWGREDAPVHIGEWHYPPSACRWGMFRGLATSSQVKAMLANTQQFQVTLEGIQGSVAFLRAQLPPNINTLQTAQQNVTMTAMASLSPTLNTSLGGTFTSVPFQEVQGLLDNNTFTLPVGVLANEQIGITFVNGPGLFVMQSVPLGANNPSLYNLGSMLYMLPPRPLAEHGAGFDGLYLVTLVDERYYWQYIPISLQVRAATTWDELIVQIGNTLGVLIYYDPIEPVYGQPEADSQLWANQESASTMLDAIAANLGRVVVRNLNGSYTLQSAATSQVIAQVNRNPLVAVTLTPGGSIPEFDANKVVRMAGGNIFQSGASRLNVGDLTLAKNSVLPAIINVSFPYYVYGNDPVPHSLNQRYVNQRPSVWYEQPAVGVYTISVTLGECGPQFALLGGTLGTSHSIHSTAKALIPNEDQGIPDNLTGLAALSLQLATDYCNWQVGVALDEVYPGTYGWTPEGFHDIIWTYSERKRQASCRAMRTQWNAMVKEMQHGTPSINPVLMTNTPRGIGGPSVAQTTRDSLASSEAIVVSTGDTVNANLTSMLAIDLGLFDSTAVFSSVDFLPTQNRWKGVIGGVETVLFEGTSGGIAAGTLSIPPNVGEFKTAGSIAEFTGIFVPGGSLTGGDVVFQAAPVPNNPGEGLLYGGELLSSGSPITELGVLLNQAFASFTSDQKSVIVGGATFTSDPAESYLVDIVSRSIDGTLPFFHVAGTILYQVAPNAVFGDNLKTWEKGQNIFPSDWTSGGIQGVNIVPQTQSVIVYSDEPTNLNPTLSTVPPIPPGSFYSGGVVLYDPPTNTYLQQETIWIAERNGAMVSSGAIYDGQFVGFSAGSQGYIKHTGGLFGADQLIPPVSTAPIYLVGEIVAGGLSVQDTLYCTKLTVACFSTDQTITVESFALFPTLTSYYIQIDSEILQVVGGAGSNTWTVNRAQLNTIAANYNTYTIVALYPFPAANLLTSINTSLVTGIDAITLSPILSVQDSRNFPTSGRYYVQIDDETFLVTAGAGTTSWTTIRAVNGTTAAAHATGTSVFWFTPDTVNEVKSVVFDDSAFVQPGIPVSSIGGSVAIHHEVTQPVRVLTSTPNASGLYDAMLEKWNAKQMKWEDDIPIWVVDLNYVVPV